MPFFIEFEKCVNLAFFVCNLVVFYQSIFCFRFTIQSNLSAAQKGCENTSVFLRFVLSAEHKFYVV